MRAALASAFPLALAVLAVLAVGAYARPVIYVEKGPLHFPVAKTFELKATAADDGDGQITSGRWDQISSPTGYVQAETPASTGVEYILKIFQPIAGEYVFRFTATSSSGESASAEVHVIVAASGAPPIVELSVPDHLVVKLPEGQVQISGSCKDPDADGFISRYLWMVAEGPENGVVLAGSDTSTLTATFALPGIYRIHFECKDKTQAAVSKMVKVLVVSGALSVAEKQVRDLPLGEHYEIRATPSSSLAEIGKFGLPVNYEWRQISGPSQISLSAVTTPVLQICSAVEGEYRFGIHMLVGGISVDEKEVVLSIGGAVFSRVLGAIVATLLVLLLFVNMATLAMSGTPPKSFFAAHCILFTPYLAPVSNMASSAMHCSTVLTLVFASGNREATFVGGFLLFLNTLGLLLKIVQELSDCTAVFKNAWWPDAAPVWSSRSTGGILSDTERGKSQFIGTYKTFQVFQASELDAPFAKRGFGSEISKRGWGVEVLSSGDAFVFCDGNHKILLADQAVCSEIDREIAKAGIQEVGLTVERESTPPEQGFPVFEIGDYFSRIAGNKSGTNSWRGHPCQVACIDHPGTPSGKSFAGVRVAASLDRALRAAFGGKFYNVSRVFDFFLMKNTSKNAGSHTVAAVITPTDCSLTAFLRMLLVALKAAQMTSLDYSGFEINAVMVSIPGEFVPEFEKRRLSKAKAQLNSSSALDGKRFLHYVFGPETFTIDLTKSPLVVISNFNASARILNARGEVGTTILNSARTPPPKDCSGDIPKFALALLQCIIGLACKHDWREKSG
eukprot:tig00000944_g5958.t1